MSNQSSIFILKVTPTVLSFSDACDPNLDDLKVAFSSLGFVFFFLPFIGLSICWAQYHFRKREEIKKLVVHIGML